MHNDVKHGDFDYLKKNIQIRYKGRYFYVSSAALNNKDKSMGNLSLSKTIR